MVWAGSSWSGYTDRYIPYAVTGTVDLAFIFPFVIIAALLYVSITSGEICTVAGAATASSAAAASLFLTSGIPPLGACFGLTIVWALVIVVAGVFALCFFTAVSAHLNGKPRLQRDIENEAAAPGSLETAFLARGTNRTVSAGGRNLAGTSDTEQGTPVRPPRGDIGIGGVKWETKFRLGSGYRPSIRGRLSGVFREEVEPAKVTPRRPHLSRPRSPRVPVPTSPSGLGVPGSSRAGYDSRASTDALGIHAGPRSSASNLVFAPREQSRAGRRKRLPDHQYGGAPVQAVRNSNNANPRTSCGSGRGRTATRQPDCQILPTAIRLASLSPISWTGNTSSSQDSDNVGARMLPASTSRKTPPSSSNLCAASGRQGPGEYPKMRRQQEAASASAQTPETNEPISTEALARYSPSIYETEWADSSDNRSMQGSPLHGGEAVEGLDGASGAAEETPTLTPTRTRFGLGLDRVTTDAASSNKGGGGCRAPAWMTAPEEVRKELWTGLDAPAMAPGPGTTRWV